MINSIDKIHGIGRYVNFDGSIPIHKNQIIFGFNGTGKSTMSDIFYSLSDSDHCLRLMNRKTLEFEDGTEVPEVSVVMSTEDGQITFQNGGWDNNGSEVHVFNDQYIEDYVTLESGHDISGNIVTFGREGTRLVTKKEKLVQEFKEALDEMSTIITHNKETKEICGTLGFNKTKLTDANWKKRCEKMSAFKPYSSSQQSSVQASLTAQTAFDARLMQLESWKSLLSQNNRLAEYGMAPEIKKVSKMLSVTPKVTNKEISEHMAHFMMHNNVNWLAEGMRNQASADKCPFCGQDLKGSRYTKLSAQLAKFVNSRQKEKADQITLFMRKVLPFFDDEILERALLSIQTIVTENGTANILHKKTLNLLLSIQPQSDLEPGCFITLGEKISNKISNPYLEIVLTESEKAICTALHSIVLKTGKVYEALNYEINVIRAKVEKDKEYELTKARYEASFGGNAENYSKLPVLAKKALALDTDIITCQKEIDNLAEKQRIDGINQVLEELNVNYRVRTEHNRFYVQIHGFVPAEYEKNNTILCSEGERRMLAFAYFMQEIKECSEQKIIVVDDPISSLDLSRKSVVAYKIVQLMENNDQIIILSHDMSFVEKIQSLISSKIDDVDYLELVKGNGILFKPLSVTDYLLSDKEVYEKIIDDGINSTNNTDKILSLMALRPYSYVITGQSSDDSTYRDIEKRSTYFAHSLYSKSSRVFFKPEQYEVSALREYCNIVATFTSRSIDSESLVPDDFEFAGFDFQIAWSIYSAIPNDSISELRKKALIFRVLLETSLYMLVTKQKFDPEHIGKFYNNACKGGTPEKKAMAITLKKLYDLSKKYHHGAENGSTLGLSSLNPDEMLYFDKEIVKIHEWIVNNMEQCNPNANNI